MIDKSSQSQDDSYKSQGCMTDVFLPRIKISMIIIESNGILLLDNHQSEHSYVHIGKRQWKYQCHHRRRDLQGRGLVCLSYEKRDDVVL